MIENRPWLTFCSHLLLALGVVAVALPVWVALTAATHDSHSFVSGQDTWWFGDLGLSVFADVLGSQASRELGVPVSTMLLNSTLMALLIALGKLSISILSAYAVVFFRFPGRMLCFWLIFITLMLPVEVRIMPTFKVVADLGLLNSMSGLTLPLIASATATFLFRQFFLTLPPELLEAARMDGAGPWRFFKDILLPLSRTNLAALFVITFIYGWNQYLWPLMITADDSHYTIVMGLSRMLAVDNGDIAWNRVMAASLLAMLPPVLVVLGMQRFFVKGLVESEK
ncbi:sn-glycerol 3-phosphate transport system permease protein [Oceanisphaera litoralis]|uniref:sn-glycerol-3-phosphate ABC transporter permease UgpE n=1 Tax=Oceanisphaera litoralis TaxID=225144 RepID=UPI0019583E31|nr:sn-glycerol-3-phosphate ABC transporter permease UgpE [Oceanisphaera litoralis]MBM7456420.1 sn-glycerol 3-phosphate transport system permease protein [Oceanisphaera litoralis]